MIRHASFGLALTVAIVAAIGCGGADDPACRIDRAAVDRDGDTHSDSDDHTHRSTADVVRLVLAVSVRTSESDRPGIRGDDRRDPHQPPRSHVRTHT
jgi:hypothetical protein